MNHAEKKKQILYRDARVTGQYDKIWQNVGKCAFCDLKDKYIILEENGVVLAITLFAYIDGHLLIIPRRHITSHKELTPEEWAAVRKLTYIAKKMIRDTHDIKGMQFVQKDGSGSQSTVGHIHFHCIPFDAPDLSVWHYRTLRHTPLENVALYKKHSEALSSLSAKYDQKYRNGVAPSTTSRNFDWAELAFGRKKPVNDLRAVFIAAPRELSAARFTQLVKTYLPQGNIVVGLAKDDYIAGFEGQPQFRTLRRATIEPIIDKVQVSTSPHKIYTLHYAQRESKYIFEKLTFQKVVLVNGSWAHAFHNRPEYYALASRRIDYDMVSPFTSEAEAQAYEQQHASEITALHSAPRGILSEAQMLEYAAQVAMQSYDHTFQTGVVLGKKQARGFTPLATTFNRVVPYQTYALHHGNSRETNFSPPHDLNHYDTIHAEVAMLLKAQQEGFSLKGTSFFINLLPCPHCSRMLGQTDIAEVVYRIDHSDGYAVRMLEAAGKKVRRIA